MNSKRLRVQFALLIGLSILVGAAALLITLAAVRDASAAARAQQYAQLSLRDARGLLSLTYEFLLHGSLRVEQQWRARYAALQADIASAATTEGKAQVATPDLGDELKSLTDMFDKLVDTRSVTGTEALEQQRRQLLIDSMVTETQSILDQVYRWGLAKGTERTESEVSLARLAVGGPVLLVLALAAVWVTLTRRVLRPLRELQQAMGRVQDGDFTARCASAGADEIGDLARAFDHMAAAQQASLRALADNELRLRTITNNLPVRIAYIDAEQRYRFANTACMVAVGAHDVAEVVGHTLRELHGADGYAELQPHVEATLRGERRSFQRTERERDELRHNEYALVPDAAADGSVRGYYALVYDVTDFVQGQARIEASLQEKDVLLREVHHRVKNNMQVISSLLQLQTGYVENAEALQLLEESQSRIKSMALIHEKLYQTNDFAQVDFADYVHSLVPMLAAAHEERAARSAVEVRADPVWLNIDQAIPAGLVLNELVSNSFKHGFPAGRHGRIDVRFTAIGTDRVRLSVCDDGVGPPPGFDHLNTHTLGLRLVNILAEQLDARLTLRYEGGFGCELEFARPARLNTGAAHVA